MRRLIILVAGLIFPAFAALAEMGDIRDPHIADVVVTASSIAIEAGKLAQSQSSNDEVKAYARQMVGAHGEVSHSVIELATKLKITLEDNPISQSLKSDGEKDFLSLQALRGEAFDKAYIHQMVVLYQNMLDTIDNQLMPHTHNEELKALLFNLFLPFSLHLDNAQQIQASLGGPAPQKAG